MGDVGFIRKLTDRTLAEFSQEPKFKVSETMSVIDEEYIPIDYIVVKIDGKTYSTDHTRTNTCKLQLVKTKEVGAQNNIWLKGVFHETANHQKIDPAPFEINIYVRCVVK